MKKQIRRLGNLILVVFMMLSLLPTSVLAEETSDKAAGYVGKKVAILGDSISTWIGVSNDPSYNTTIGNSAVYFGPGMNNLQLEDTWWMQAIDALGMKLLVNNSWSGSCMLRARAGTPGAYVDRCVQLHNDMTGEDPDVIWIYLGTNDFPNDWGTVDSINSALITDNGDGTYCYAEPVSFIEAYAIALHKMHLRYPNAEIYCFGILRRSYISDVLTNCNNETKKLVESMGHTYVDLESCIDNTAEDFRLCNGGDELHPAPVGMDRITRKVLSAMLDSEVNEYYKVSYALINATVDNAALMAWEGGTFRVKVTPTGPYNALNIIVMMDGRDVTAECCSQDGEIFIENVTGKIYIVARSKNAPHIHDYSKVVTAPTGTEKGYTTYTCACGDSYVSDYIDPVDSDLDAGLLGDADGNGLVDYVDAMIVLQYHTGVVGNDALDLNCCDVDGSGAVDYVDAMLILQYHTGVISKF